MKKLLFLLLFPVAAWAKDPFNFKVGVDEYRMFQSSVESHNLDGKIFIQSMWEVKTPMKTYRWVLYVSNCAGPIGQVTIKFESTVALYNWSWEGNLVYDNLAAATCLAAYVK